ncbi:hypothetical protein HD554DRAFT_2040719 [Boletus coccyginus]|nr:hypothetical protein HD554DRAFT_2040719 [Boletus coccyginus]
MCTGEREMADEGEGETCEKFQMGKREGAADKDACGGGEGDSGQGWPRASMDVVSIGASCPWDRRRGIIGVGRRTCGVEGVRAFDIVPVGGFLAIEFLGEMGEG